MIKPLSTFIAATACAAVLSVYARAELSWDKTEIKVPATFGQPTLQAEFPVKNAGTGPVTIREVTTSCGCTYAAASQEVVKPGETAQIAVFFETEGREGPQSSTIKVVTDDAKHPTKVLKFRSDIPQAAALPTRVVRWKANDQEARTLSIPTQPGVELSVGQPKRPLPVSIELSKTEIDGKPGYTLTLTPRADKTSGSGILPIEANWDDQQRLYNIYVRR